MSQQLKKLMESKDKEIRQSTNILDKLFRQLLKDLNITTISWNRLVTRYYHSRYCKTPKNAKDLSSDRNNFNRALAKGSITWNNFIRACRIMGAVRIDVSITMHWRNKTRTVHTVEVSNPLAELDDGIELDTSNFTVEVIRENEESDRE